MTVRKGAGKEATKATVDASHTEIKSWTDLHGKLESMRDTGWIFRGVTSPKHYLVPSIGREAVYGPYKLAQEKRLFEEFKNRAVALVKDNRFDDWD